MNGHLKIVGTNKGTERLKNASGSSELTHKYHKLYTLKFQEEEFVVELLDFIILDKFIEYSAWIGDKDNQYGRIAFQFEPHIN